jgi:hypothetical protein
MGAPRGVGGILKRGPGGLKILAGSMLISGAAHPRSVPPAYARATASTVMANRMFTRDIGVAGGHRLRNQRSSPISAPVLFELKFE